MEQAHKEQENLYQQVNSIDPALLLGSQKLTYRILMKSFRYEQETQGLELYYEPLVPSSDIQSAASRFTTEYAFYDKGRGTLSDAALILTGILNKSWLFEKSGPLRTFMTDTCADEIISQAQPYLLSAEHNPDGNLMQRSMRWKD